MGSRAAEERRQQVKTSILPALDLRPFIDGDFRDPSSSKAVTVLDPMTHEALVNVPSADGRDVDRAVTAARESFDTGHWRMLHPRERAKYLYRIADLIDQHAAEIALLEAVDTGRRLPVASSWDLPNAAEVYRYYAGWADKITGRVLPSAAGVEMTTHIEPVGVCAAIIPWNFPFVCMAWKMAPALAAGCSMVVKSAERTPLSAQYLARLLQEADLPPGVVNILTGIGEESGRHLVADPRVDKITFTGEAATARDILLNSLNHLPRVTFELGDKMPFVIFADADLERAVAAATGAMFGVAGQNCCAGSRVLVEEAAAEEVVSTLAEAARARRLGDQLDESTEQGPQVDAAHVAAIDAHVRRALDEGAECVVGGSPSGAIGQFYRPTILSNVTRAMRIAREEVFGPVGAVLTFRRPDEAITLANDRDFGLAASVWTANPQLARQFADEARCGTCWINCYEYFDTVAPWGGRKLSGVGRELGREGLEAFLETKTVVRVL